MKDKKINKADLMKFLPDFTMNLIEKVTKVTGLETETVNSFLGPGSQNAEMVQSLIANKVITLINFDRFEIIAEPGHPLYENYFHSIVDEIAKRVIHSRETYPSFIVSPANDLFSEIQQGNLAVLQIETWLKKRDTTWDNDEGDGVKTNTWGKDTYLKNAPAYKEPRKAILIPSEYSSSLGYAEEQNIIGLGLSPAPLQYVVGLGKITDKYFPLTTTDASAGFEYTQISKGRKRSVLKDSVVFEEYVEEKPMRVDNFCLLEQNGQLELAVHNYRGGKVPYWHVMLKD